MKGRRRQGKSKEKGECRGKREEGHINDALGEGSEGGKERGIEAEKTDGEVMCYRNWMGGG